MCKEYSYGNIENFDRILERILVQYTQDPIGIINRTEILFFNKGIKKIVHKVEGALRKDVKITLGK